MRVWLLFFPRIAGHAKEVAGVKALFEHAVDLAAKCFIRFAFITENWQQPWDEVYPRNMY
jgi:undecaprenyl diphosphate synthase